MSDDHGGIGKRQKGKEASKSKKEWLSSEDQQETSVSQQGQTPNLKPDSNKRIPYKVVEEEDGVVEYYNDYDRTIHDRWRPRISSPPPLTAEERSELAKKGIFLDLPQTSPHRFVPSPEPEICEVCFKPGHDTVGCPYLLYVPRDAPINDEVAFKYCQCGQNFSEDGPCPEDCTEPKQAILRFVWDLPPTCNYC